MDLRGITEATSEEELQKSYKNILNNYKNLFPDSRPACRVYDYDEPFGEELAIETIPTRIRTFDAVLQGGFRRKELATIMARFSHGKSTILGLLGARFYLQGYHVLHLVLEDNIADIKRIYDSTLDYYKVSRSNILGKVFIVDAMTTPIKIGDLEKLTTEYRPDVVIIDYVDAFTHNMAIQTWDALEDLMREFRRIAHKHNCLVLTASQATLDDGNPTEMKASRLKGSKAGKAAVTDILWGIIHDQNDPNLLWFTNIKSKGRRRDRGLPVYRMGVDFNVPRVWSKT